MKRRVAILGSTGSIGRQALEVIAALPERFEIVALAARQNGLLLEKQAVEFGARVAVLTQPPADFTPSNDTNIQWGFSETERDAICAMDDVDDVLVSVVGMAGLSAVLACIAYKKRVLLANKETLMTGGSLVMQRAKEAGVEIMPIDSEHTAIYQCLLGNEKNQVRRLLLTASGGPFRTATREEMRRATLKQALSHPNWAMGRKITIDSATMMNKCIEIVEAHHLFSMPPEKIQVVVHPQSILHSAVEYDDGAIMANLGAPDMRIPIAYALLGGERMDFGARRLSMFDMPQLTFERCDEKKFPCVRLAYQALAAGGNACVIINAANEVAVEAFLRGQIGFGTIEDIIFASLDHLFSAQTLNDEQIFFEDKRARAFVRETLRT